MVQTARHLDEEIQIGRAKKSKAGTIRPRIKNRFSNPHYIRELSSGRPEAVVKVVGYTSGFRVKKVLDYIARLEKLEINKEKNNDNRKSAEPPQHFRRIRNLSEHNLRPLSQCGLAHNGNGQTKSILQIDARFNRRGIENLRRNQHVKKTVDCENHDSKYLAGPQAIQRVYDDWKQTFAKKKPGLRRQKRDAAHLMLSGDCENTPENATKVLEAARQVIKQEIGDKGFDFVAALHEDSNRPHVHFIVRTKNRYKGKGKLRLNPPELFRIRRQFAKNLRELGLDHVATNRKDRPQLIERVAQGLDRLNKNERQFQRAMKRAAPNRDAFLYRKQVSQTIVRLREQIKKETAKGSKERLELLGNLRSVERKLTKSRPNIEKEINATLNKYEKDFQRFQTTLGDTPKDNKKDAERLKTIIAEEQKRFQQNISAARESIENENTPEQVKKDTLALLDQYEKRMNQALKKGPVEVEKPKEFNQEFTALYSSAEKAIEMSKQEPQTAVERLKKRRALDQAAQELKKQIKTTRKKIQTSNTDQVSKRKALSKLRLVENRLSQQLKRPLTVGRSLTR